MLVLNTGVAYQTPILSKYYFRLLASYHYPCSCMHNLLNPVIFIFLLNNYFLFRITTLRLHLEHVTCAVEWNTSCKQEKMAHSNPFISSYVDRAHSYWLCRDGLVSNNELCEMYNVHIKYYQKKYISA